MRKQEGLWSLGPQMLDLGFTALRSMGISESVQDALQRLADACHGTALYRALEVPQDRWSRLDRL